LEVIGIAAMVINDDFVKSNTGLNPQNINFGIKSEHIMPLLNNITPGNGNIRNVNDAERATVLIQSYYWSQARQTQTTMTVVNRTGYTAYYVYISPSSHDSWGIDRLGSDVLLTGQSSILRNIPVSENNRYDIRLVDSDGDSYTKWNVQMMPNQSITFTFDDFDTDSGNTQTVQTFDGPPIIIVNNTGYDVYFVYISPSSSSTWGSDRLDSNQILSNRQSASLDLPHSLSVINKYDIKLVDSDGDSYTKFNIIVTANSRIVFTLDDFDR
jgi:hypothetical protein